MNESSLLTEMRIGLLLGGDPKVIVHNLAKSGRHPPSDLMLGLLHSNHPEAIVRELEVTHDAIIKENKCSLLLK